MAHFILLQTVNCTYLCANKNERCTTPSYQQVQSAQKNLSVYTLVTFYKDGR